jgi:transposase InsO family protein
MKRRTSLSVTERNLPLVGRIKTIKSEHPFWGYRRIWAHLRYIDGLEVNKKRILRLMRENQLLVKPNIHLRATRTPQRSKPRPDRPNQWWGIDMTKVMVDGFGWMYIVAVLDWFTKKIVGYTGGIQCRAVHWLEALDMAVNSQFPSGVQGQGLSLMSDNGSQPTSLCFMKSCRDMGIKQAFTSYGNPKGNADTERVFRTMKEELLWLREWHSPFELTDALARWVAGYNRFYLHSALGYKSPMKFEEEYQGSQIAQPVPV